MNSRYTPGSDDWRGPDGRPRPIDDAHARQRAKQDAEDRADWKRGNEWTAGLVTIITVASVVARAYLPRIGPASNRSFSRAFGIDAPVLSPIDWTGIIFAETTIVVAITSLLVIMFIRMLMK